MKGIFTIIFLVILLANCTENLDPSPLNYTEIISGKNSKTWQLRSLVFRNDDEDYWKLNPSCWTDDLYTFYRDSERKFEFTSGSVKCDVFEDKITITDSWSLINATSTLFFVVPIFSDSPIPFTVVDIDRNDMTLQLYFDDQGNQSYQLKFVLKDEE